MFQRQRILGANVDEAVLCANGIGANDHPFEHGMRITFQYTAVHECAGVPLIGVADDEFWRSRSLATGFPFVSGRESPTSSASQARSLDFSNDLLRFHRSQDFDESRVTSDGNVILDLARIKQLALTKEYTILLAVERYVIFADNGFP